MIIVLDNYDSFTYNLAQYLGELGKQVKVYRNDEISTAQLRARRPEAIVLSPGPCTPDQAGISMELCREAAGDCPILGVCLGMQSMVQAYGGKVVRARTVMHGKTSDVYHDEDAPLFVGLSSPFAAGRYHSLIVEEQNLPAGFRITARSGDPVNGPIMAIRHRVQPMMGVQFHPESILTECGKMLLTNFINFLN